MTTKLTKGVTRECIFTSVARGKHTGKALIVTLLPSDELEIRIKGTRQAFRVPLSHCLNLAYLMDAGIKYKEAKEEYKVKKKAGVKRLREPKMPDFKLSKIFFDAAKLRLASNTK